MENHEGQTWWVQTTKNSYSPLSKKLVVYESDKIITLGTAGIAVGGVLTTYNRDAVRLIEQVK